MIVALIGISGDRVVLANGVEFSLPAGEAEKYGLCDDDQIIVPSGDLSAMREFCVTFFRQQMHKATFEVVHNGKGRVGKLLAGTPISREDYHGALAL